MKSPLLASRVRQIFGSDGAVRLDSLLAQAGKKYPELTSGVGKLIDAADGLICRLLDLQQIRSDLSGDAFSDWNLVTGRIESGKQWKALLGYGDSELEDTVSCWKGLLHPDDLATFCEAISDHSKGRTRSFQSECRLRTRSG